MARAPESGTRPTKRAAKNQAKGTKAPGAPPTGKSSAKPTPKKHALAQGPAKAPGPKVTGKGSAVAPAGTTPQKVADAARAGIPSPAPPHAGGSRAPGKKEASRPDVEQAEGESSRKQHTSESRGASEHRKNEFDPAFQKEVEWNEFPVPAIDVAPIAGDLLKYVRSKAAAFVLGSPGCGKSSLMRYIIQKEAYEKYGFTRVVEVKKNTDVDAVMDDLQTRGEKAKCLFLVDEVQRAVAQGWADPSALYKQGFFAMYFGTTALITQRFATPAELAPHKFWMYAPSLDRKVVQKYVESVLALYDVSKAEAEKLAPWLFDYAGASMNALVYTLKAIVEHRDPAKPLALPAPTDVIDRTKGPRVVVNGERNWAKVSGKVELAAELLAGGVAPIDGKSSDARKELLRNGTVQPVPDYGAEPAAALRQMDDTSTLTTWAHPWQRLYARKQLKIQAAKVVPVPDLRAGVPQATIDAVVRFLPLMDPFEEAAEHTKLHTPDRRKLNERHLQSVVKAAACNDASGVKVHNEVAAEREEKTPGDLPRLDFVLMPKGDQSPINMPWRMGLELTAAATPTVLEEHVDRFDAAKGKYASLTLDDWLVLDFRMQPQTRKQVADRLEALAGAPSDEALIADKSRNVATVSPHMSYGWGVAVLDYRGKRVYLPLDGVPRYVPDWDAAAPEAVPTQTAVTEPCVDVRVALPDGPLQTDVAPVIRRDRLKMNVDGLRRAIIADLPREVAPGATVGDLTVYPPGATRGAAPIADPYTELEPTTKEKPYLVTVAGVSPTS